MGGSLDRYRTMASDDLAETYRSLAGLVRAAEAQKLLVLSVLDEREAWKNDGALDAAQWVAMTEAVPAGAAMAAVETARSLRELPAVAAVAEVGGLSMAQLVPLAVIASPDTDERWAHDGPGMTPAALAQLSRQQRRVDRDEAERKHRRRSFRWWRDRHGLGTRFAGLLPDDQAAVVTGAIERLAEDAPKNEQGLFEPHESRCADALVELASASQAAAGVAEVVVHVPVGLAKQPHLTDGTVLSIDTIRRLTCDSTARLLVENPDGTVAGYGRRKRIVPEKMRLRIRHRDGDTCCWHGCSNRRCLKAHHIEHWATGGRTDEDNCVLLCGRHHHLVHEGGWTIAGSPLDHTLEFRRPTSGTAVPAAPTPAPAELLDRYGLTAA